MEGYVHSIETMGTVDGPGIRFVVFLQGCPLRCKYCHNPDSWRIGIGEKKSVEEILERYERYLPYLKNGGITVTGGEPLRQIQFVTRLFEKARERGIHTCLDTSGITFDKNDKNIVRQFICLTKVTNLVMLDIKHMDSEKHRELTGASNENVLDFLEFLDESGMEIWIRHVVVPGLTDDRESLNSLGELIGHTKNVKAIDILPYHTMGRSKYKKLGMTYPLDGIPDCTPEDAAKAREVIMEGVRTARFYAG